MFSRLAILSIALISVVYPARPVPDQRQQQAASLIRKGNFVEAARLYLSEYEELKQTGVEDERLAEAASDLAGTYTTLDRYTEAERLLNEALAIDRRVSGPDGPDTARHSVTLAKVFVVEHRIAEGEALLLYARPILERAYGPQSMRVAAVLNHLGLVAVERGQLKQGEALYRQSMSIYEKESQPALASVVMTNLVAILVDQGKLDEAADLAKKCESTIEAGLGPDHLFTARALHALGIVYQAQSRVDEARAVYERALEIWYKNPGAGLQDAATVESSLAAIYTTQGYYAKAEALLKKALATRESVLRPDNPELAGTLNNLGVLLTSENRLTEAEKVLEKALAISEAALGPKHPRTVPLLINLACVYAREGRNRKDFYVKSEALLRRVLAAEEERFGPDHIEVANTLIALAGVCVNEKHYRDAKQLEGRAVAIRQAVLGPRHPATVRAIEDYTLLLRKSPE